MWLAPTGVSCSDPPRADDGTCCTVEPVATLPSCFLSSSSSCMDILEAAAGALKPLPLPAAAAAASSARSFAFCCRYCRVWAHMGPGVTPPAQPSLLPPDPNDRVLGEGRSACQSWSHAPVLQRFLPRPPLTREPHSGLKSQFPTPRPRALPFSAPDGSSSDLSAGTQCAPGCTFTLNTLRASRRRDLTRPWAHLGATQLPAFISTTQHAT